MNIRLFGELMVMGLVFGNPAFALAHDGPHGGELFCEGKHITHAELVMDQKAGKAIVYILDKKAKNEHWIPAKTISMKVKGDDSMFELAASNTKDGKSSEFVLKHPRFGGKIKANQITFEIVVEEGKSAMTFKPEHDDDD